MSAWCLAVEEQGQKTLHGHFLIWAKDWDSVLKAAYAYQTRNNAESPATEDSIHLSTNAATAMTDFMNSAVCTKCFDIKIPVRPSNSNTRGFYTMGECARNHECTDNVPSFEFSTDQELRHMRFRHCPETEECIKIAKCLKCNKSFTLDSIIASSMSTIISSKLGLPVDSTYHEIILRYIVSISQSGIKNLEFEIDGLQPEIKRFLIHLHRNLHKQCHTFT